MCGIVGYIGNNKAKEILINGLKCLEYRGYDSAGIATIENNKITVMKEKGRVSNLESLDGIDELSGTVVLRTLVGLLTESHQKKMLILI